MQSLILASLLAFVIRASPLGEQESFRAFKAAHVKIYKNQEEETERFAIFSKNLREIEKHNALFKQGLVSFEKGVNQFTDMTQDEFIATLTGHLRPVLNTTEYVPTGVVVPASIDYRTLGQVTGVKNQGPCGSCWAFAVVGSVEAAYQRKSGKLVSLSEQQLVDCSTDNDGCEGGSFPNTYPYIKQYGLESEETYPYKAADGTCKYDATKVVTKISSFVSLKDDEPALLEAVGSVGPVAIAIDASYISSYKSGVYTDSRCKHNNRNHAILIVGYGHEGGLDYWLVKNSWGASWGEEGYIKIRRGTNECGVAEDDVYPIA